MPSLIHRITALFVILLPTIRIAGQELHFENISHSAIKVEAPSMSGLNAIYVLPSTDGATVSFASPDAVWQRFSAMGAAYAETVPSTTANEISTLSKLEGNVGYSVTSGGKTYYFWITDHSAYPFALRDIKLNPAGSSCEMAELDIDGEGERIPYYTINGVPQWLSRELELTYSTLEFSTDDFVYVQTERTEIIEGFSDETIHCTTPLCQTDFSLTGDRFMRQWGFAETIVSPVYDTTAVGAQTRATQQQRDNDNEVKIDTSLGGSGPVEITFEAAVTDAAIFHEWQMAHDADFQQVFMRSSDLEFTYVFREQGTIYVRLTAANSDGTCETNGDTYDVFIGESQLKCPNAFSPGTSPGMNDVWKVSYKSIIEFECHIFDRQGRQLAHLTNPAQGWDGKRGGKTVGPGVYFYVIRAKGADGKVYKLSGDINVIGHKQNKNTTDAAN